MSGNKKESPQRLAKLIRNIRSIMGLNIGTIMFGILFLYMIFSAVLYLTSSHTESYQVTSGPLSRNETYTGLAIREENVVQADLGGYATYYAREGSKINANGAVFGLSSTKTPEANVQLSQEELSDIRSDMQSFSKVFNPSKFNSTYSFKYQLEGNILQYAGVTQDADGADEEGAAQEVVTFGNQTISKAVSDGIILYSKDGYEGKTLKTVTKEDFDQNAYHETDLKTAEPISAGDDVYTIITDERWSLLIPLSEKQAVKLADRSAIRVKFLKDDMTQTGDFSIVEIEGDKYGKIDFNKGLVRYATDRFLEIELVTNTVSGLKIPLSSIVTKEFYTIPSSFSTVNEDSQQEGFLVEETNREGERVTTFQTTPIYASVEQPNSGTQEEAEVSYTYYVEKSAFEEGDVILDPNGSGKYVIGDTAILEGVYCINQGYAVFKRIEILDQNEEYAIVKKGTAYGLSRYDHIVKNAEDVKEEDILY